MRHHCRKSRVSLFAIALVFSCAIRVAPLHAQSEPEKRSEVPARSTKRGETSSIGLLVLTSGRVVTGRVSPRSDGYMVEQSAGYMFIPAAQVRFEADNLNDAYDKLSKSINEHTPNTHLAVANWCVSNKLYREAREEVLDALDLQPNRADCQKFLVRIEQLMQQGSVKVSTPKKTVARDKWEPPAESLAGLSRSAAQRFNTHIQPILQNKCGTCHATRDSAERGNFVLLRSGRNHRAVAERNLAIVLRNIDTDVPTSSPILQATRLGHGGRSRSVFEGRAGQRQIQNLRDWVFHVAAEQSRQTSRDQQTHKLASAQFTTNESPSRRSHKTEPDTREDISSPGKRFFRDSFSKHGRDLPIGKAAEDPFDPAAFNRREGKTKSVRR